MEKRQLDEKRERAIGLVDSFMQERRDKEYPIGPDDTQATKLKAFIRQGAVPYDFMAISGDPKFDIALIEAISECCVICSEAMPVQLSIDRGRTLSASVLG